MNDADLRWARRFESSVKRIALRERSVALLGGKCCLCGYDRCLGALEFHHVDPEEKEFSISTRMSWEAVEKELLKCRLVCSNCHREIHSGLHPNMITQPDDGRGSDEEDERQVELPFFY
jgi:hypothetical protein